MLTVKNRKIEPIIKNIFGKSKGISKKKLIDAPFESNFKTIVKEFVLSAAGRWSWWNSCSYTISKKNSLNKLSIKVTQEVFKLNKSVMNKEQGDQIQFSPKKS